MIMTLPLNSTAGETMNVLSLILNSDPVVQATLALLIFFSIFSWAIILLKFFQIRGAKKKSAKFNDVFDNSQNLEDILNKKSINNSPLYEILVAGLKDILLAKQQKAKDPTHRSHVSLDKIQKEVRRSSDQETSRLELLTPFLATTASASPFIGLFGTVWGILIAFWKIKDAAGTSTLQTVGPHIAEALIATAVGLAAAIPAVIFYNYFITKIKALARTYEDFSFDLLRRVEHEYF